MEKHILKKYFYTLAIVILISYQANNAIAKPIVGEVALPFKAMNTNAEMFDLDANKGKIVVLEWTNHLCPFVKKHYETNNMQSLQKKYTSKDVVWVSIISSASGKQGYLETGTEANNIFKDRNSNPSHIIRDESGKIGKLYQATTTPHMFIIDKEGRLAYQGAIDSIPSASKNDVSRARNYVSLALDELIAGKEVTKKSSSSYGCSIKY